MGKSSKKFNTEVAATPMAISPMKSGKKGKRHPEVATEKQSAAKKQKKEVEEVIEKQKSGKKLKASFETMSKKKPETSSSEDVSSSESEEEVKTQPKKNKKPTKIPVKQSSSEESSSDEEAAVSAKKLPIPVSKNGSMTKKRKPSSSSESDSDEEEEETKAEVPIPSKKLPIAAAKNGSAVVTKKKQESSDSSDSSDSDSSSEEDNKKAAPKKAAPKKDDSEDESSDDSSDESDEEPQKKKSKVQPNAKASKDSSSDEDEDASSEESSDDEPGKKQPPKPAVTAKKGSSSDEESSEESEDEQPAKTPKKKATDVKMADALGAEAKSEKKAPKTPATPSAHTPGSKTLFVGNLPYSIERADVEAFFKEAGEVVDVRFSSDPEGVFKGFGHVEFATEAAAQKALKLNGQELSGRAVRIDLARERGAYTPGSGKEGNSYQKSGRSGQGFDNSLDENEPKTSATPGAHTSGSKTLFVGNLSYSIERADVEAFFKEAGEVVDVRFSSDPEGVFKGFGHVEFATEAAAQKALKLNGQELSGRAVRIDLARERGAYTPGSGKEGNSYQKSGRSGQTKTIFVRGFDKSLDENEIRSSLEEHFGSFGEIKRIAVPKDYETGASKGVAYLDFTDGDSFSKALELNGSELGGYNLTVEEARPRNDNRDDGGRSGGGRSGGGRGGGGRRGGGRGGGRFGGGRGRGTPKKQGMAAAGTGKKTTFGDE